MLEGLLGAGGMGVVYKAQDRIKVEAKDRNPYVAIKVLNEDFKAHPEAFISLQRECSKAQRLAHPNIATVYDFDRTGGMAFMTMELLDGQPLNEYFATQLPDSGLAFDDAWPIIEGLARALGHAHRNRIVHSDFKPGNAFICDNGEVKVLDFGIARAVKPPGQADTTTFDAGKLGALTPTYASPEMLDGEPPDPRDDIYALGVVSYILLSSTHPFDRHPANLAQAMDLKPKPIANLTRTQNEALARALDFDRDKRTPRHRDVPRGNGRRRRCRAAPESSAAARAPAVRRARRDERRRRLPAVCVAAIRGRTSDGPFPRRRVPS